MGMFGRPMQQPRPQRESGENCKITVKNTKNGRTISFQGKCSREQLEMAKISSGAESVEEE